MRIIVIGAGIGGLAAALTLRRAGLDVRVFEQAAELREVGAGIQISPNASRILNRLGLEEPMRRMGMRPRAILIRRWDDGREIARQPLADACERNFGAPYYNFHRADLLDLLSAAVPDGVLHLDHRCVGLTQHAGLAEDVLDHRLNARTVYMNPIFRFLYWNMNYHVEHHLFPTVPYHALPKLHEAIKADCPEPYPSSIAAYREIIPALARQLKDPTYFVRRELPDTARSVPHRPVAAVRA